MSSFEDACTAGDAEEAARLWHNTSGPALRTVFLAGVRAAVSAGKLGVVERLYQEAPELGRQFASTFVWEAGKNAAWAALTVEYFPDNSELEEGEVPPVPPEPPRLARAAPEPPGLARAAPENVGMSWRDRYR